MAETPKRAGPTALTTASATIYTAGGAATWTILREVVLTNTGTVAINVKVGVGTTNTDTTAKRIIDQITVNPGEPFEWACFIPLAGHASTPDLVYALADSANGNITLGVVEGP